METQIQTVVLCELGTKDSSVLDSNVEGFLVQEGMQWEETAGI